MPPQSHRPLYSRTRFGTALPSRESVVISIRRIVAMWRKKDISSASVVITGERWRRVVVAGERDVGLHGDGVGGERPAEYGGGERLQQIRGLVCDVC
ncbi:hypothetical protein Acr_00g0059820 [Actinidia rufa]|uniref:Uncharacterized protein n=1 Tax=Actinidia rufa TaxID=165716 RepID=A0A7J0DPN7_9ERIC|nr:hypothetical protein Acr_00g0059820 [Actinidia rufa]